MALAAPVVVGMMFNPATRGAAQIGVRKVEYLLVICVRVNGGHEAAFDLELVVNHFRRRRQAVRGAGSVRDHIMFLRIIFVFVDAEHHGQVFAFGGSGNDDFLRAAFGDVIDCAFDRLALFVYAIFLDGEQAGRLDHNINPQTAPRNRGRISLLEDFHLLAIDRQAIIVHFDGAVETAIGRIVLEQVRHGLGVANIVERHNLKFFGIIIADRFKT